MKGRSRALDEMTAETSKWVADVGALLAAFDQMLAVCRLPEDAPPEMRKSVEHLKPAVRQCRAQQPNEIMVKTWLRHLTDDNGEGEQLPRPSPRYRAG
jgi:hypothetical protein